LFIFVQNPFIFDWREAACLLEMKTSFIQSGIWSMPSIFAIARGRPDLFSLMHPETGVGHDG